MDFDTFSRDVLAKMDEWAKAIHEKTKEEAAVIKEEGEDLIAGWKNAYPRRRNEISGIVAHKLSQIFGRE